ncbi:hypothetical protein [Aliiroseovarius sp. F20344]|uniref:hypothetical protein n=1 Tax=Aliiroseovarius sp. F20344 TaxID=2926414 RepID=UPI001FF60C55|nr:hypothetical protein [Aliiroseovarius sp. F20344]MCK0142775.1 hypothetical protein [Aliiroseovarius sp. F20344]
MGLESMTEKLDKYYDRLEKGKTRKIKPGHVSKVINKLNTKAGQLEVEISEAVKPDKKQRLERKLALVRKQQERANWLQKSIGEQ